MINALSRAQLKNVMVGLSVAENGGDIADALIELCEAIGEPPPRWSGAFSRYVLAWEDLDGEDPEFE